MIAFGVRPGVYQQASLASLPAAIAKVTPDAIEFVTAVSSIGDAPRASMLMFATAGLMRFLVIQSIPAMTFEISPCPLQGRTRTACNETPFATPYVSPPTIPLHLYSLRSVVMRDLPIWDDGEDT